MGTEWGLMGVELQGTYVQKQVDRANRNLLLFSLALIVGVGVYGAAHWKYFYNFFRGPVEMDAKALAAVQTPGALQRYFVAVQGENSIDTGLQEVEQQVSQSGSVEGETVKADYSVLTLGGRFLVVKRKPNDNGKSFQGALVGLPGDVHTQVVTPLLSSYPNADQVFLPLMLDAAGFRKKGYIALAICIPILAIAFLLISTAMKHKNNPLTDPILKSLSKYGPLPDVARQIDAEVAGAPGKIGSAIVGQSWILVPGMFSFAACHVSDLVWAYKKVTKRSVNFIPAGKSYSTIVYDRFGKPVEISAGEKDADKLLESLAVRAPWAVFGFSEDLKKAVDKDWAGLVAAVDARRAKG